MTDEAEGAEVPGDDVPEYPGDSDRELWLDSPEHVDIEDIDPDDERLQ